jgi:hypothetical protein
VVVLAVHPSFELKQKEIVGGSSVLAITCRVLAIGSGDGLIGVLHMRFDTIWKQHNYAFMKCLDNALRV